MGCLGAVSKENCIIAEFDIDEENTNKEVLIMESTENILREIPKEDLYPDEEKQMEQYKDEKEISQCSIRVNEALIPFCYKYKFQAPGTYTIKYTFPKALTQTSFMFSNCSRLKKIDLSNFDTSNLIKARGMIQGCTNLESIKFFDSPIEKVTDMIAFCSSCEKMKNISLSNFNKEMTVNMKEFFFGCEELETVDLSNFKAKIISAEDMFYDCSKIKKIDLSSFTTTKDSKIASMFDKIPSSMEKKNLITKDKNILDANDYGEEGEGGEGEDPGRYIQYGGGDEEGGGYSNEEGEGGEGMIEGDFIPDGEEGEEGDECEGAEAEGSVYGQ